MTKHGALLGIGIGLAIVLFAVIAPQRQEAERKEARRRAELAGNISEELIPASENAPARKRFTGRMEEPGVGGKLIDLSTLDAPPEIGAKAMALSRDPKGDVLLRLNFFSEARCMMGDLDIINADIERRGNPPLLLTVEAFDKNEFPPLVRQIKPRDLQSGTITFSLPLLESPASIAVYLCSDETGDRRCSSKPAVDLNRLTEEVYPGISSKKGEDATKRVDRSEKIYYFQYFVLENNTLTLFNTMMEPEAYSGLGNYLGSRFGSLNVSALRSAGLADKIKNLNNTIRSAPPVTNLNALRINLPRNEHAACPLEEMPEELQKKLKEAQRK